MPEEKPKDFNAVKHLKPEDKKNFDFVVSRIKDLQSARQEEQFGIKIENIWADADKDFAPHRLGTTGKRVLVQDEEQGWASTLVKLGSSNWQSDISQPNAFIKITTAVSNLIDKNPTGVFSAGMKKYQSTNELQKQLYQRSWEIARSKQQLKLFAFNLAKYGFACGRTYPLKITNNNVVEYDDIFRENLDVWNVWIDDMALPNNQFSVRDWAWRKVYALDALKTEYGDSPNFKFVKAGGNTEERVAGNDLNAKKRTEKELVEVLFYENKVKNIFAVIANGVPITLEELPIEDINGSKKLTLWSTYWQIRHAQCIYGIGIYEAIRYDQAMLDRFRNMTIDQLTLSIYKMFFYTGTNNLQATGDITITPGVGKEALDPKGINWLDVPGPGAEAWKGIEMFKNDIDEASGITQTLQGVSDEKTAFQSSIAKESALKRLKTPLDNICDALEQEAYITVCVNQLIYSEPEIRTIADPDLIEAYLKDIQSDPNLFERSADENGIETFKAKLYPEVPLNLEEDEKKNLTATNDTKFFRIKPGSLRWDGVISIKAQSILTPSKQLDKTLELEMYNMLIPLLIQPPEVYSKVAKNICKLYEKDPKDVLPDNWLEGASQELIVPMPQQMDENGQPVQTGMGAPKLTANPTRPVNPTSTGGAMISKMVSPMRI
jgi:hypothetical protein